MDLVDISSAEAIPVDYKRGRVPDVEGGAWEPEQVQLCAQGLVLRENGYVCQQGFLYFIGSRRRVSVPLDETLVQRTRELLRAMRSGTKEIELGWGDLKPIPAVTLGGEI